MSENRNDKMSFRLPKYHEIPNVGLYLEQTTRYIAECFAPLLDGVITASMISNYVKRGLVSSPVKKQYSREQIAYLIYITTVKTVLSMEDIRLMLHIQQEAYETQLAYDYFCTSLEEMLSCIESGERTPDLPEGKTEDKLMLHNTVVAVAHTICLRKQFAALQQKKAAEKPD